MTNEDMEERLARIEDKLGGVSRLEKQLASFLSSWESMSDLGRDLSHLMEPAVKQLTEGMMEVEIGFQLEDLFTLIKKGLLSLKYITWGLEQLENLVDLWNNMEPLLRIAIPNIVDRLDDMEVRGVFRTYAAMLEVRAKVAAHYPAEEITAMSDGFVLLLSVLKKLSQPEMMDFFNRLMDIPMRLNLEDVKPVGPMAMLWAMRSREARQGLGFMLGLTKALGRLEALNQESPLGEGK
jgi:uncharacterized protein YjgD (DUF1641 family)